MKEDLGHVWGSKFIVFSHFSHNSHYIAEFGFCGGGQKFDFSLGILIILIDFLICCNPATLIYSSSRKFDVPLLIQTYEN